MRCLGILPALVLLVGCSAVNPALRYQEAARQLRFTLERVDSRIELALPLETSRLRLLLTVGVDNPSDVSMRIRRVKGDLRLTAQGGDHALGSVDVPQGADIMPRRRNTMKVEVAMAYGDMRAAWGPLAGAVQRHEPALWSLDGEARLDVMGIELSVPLKVFKESGR